MVYVTGSSQWKDKNSAQKKFQHLSATPASFRQDLREQFTKYRKEMLDREGITPASRLVSIKKQNKTQNQPTNPHINAQITHICQSKNNHAHDANKQRQLWHRGYLKRGVIWKMARK